MTPSSLVVVEVAPRDGLQDEATVLSTAAKVALIERLLDAGVRRIEAVSFVNPERVPQMADAEAVLAALPRREGTRLTGLVLNERGLERAIEAGVDEVNFVVPATDSFGRRNQGCTTDEAVAAWERIASRCSQEGVGATVTLAVAFGCPFEGEVSIDRVAELAERVAAARPSEIALADTIGIAVPVDVTRLVEAVAARTAIPLRGHFHDSRGAGVANALAAVAAGVSGLDSSLGGIGGCPSAPSATGNIATEDIVHVLERSGIDTGIDLTVLIASVPWLEDALGHPVPGHMSRASATA